MLGTEAVHLNGIFFAVAEVVMKVAAAPEMTDMVVERLTSDREVPAQRKAPDSVAVVVERVEAGVLQLVQAAGVVPHHLGCNILLPPS